MMYSEIQSKSTSNGQEHEYAKEEDGRMARGAGICSSSTQKRDRQLLFCYGFLFIAISLTIQFLDPLEMFIHKLTEISDGNYAYRMWKDPPVNYGAKVYIFNYTNTEAFLRGEEPLKVKELGPYAFTMRVEKKNVTFNDNNTMSFMQYLHVDENQELTIGNAKNDTLVTVNTLYLGAATYLSNASIFTKTAFSTVTTMLNMEPFLKMTVDEFLWGYDEPLIKYANKFLPSVVDFDKLGVLDRVYNVDPDVITLNMNREPTVRADGLPVGAYTIDRLSGEAGLRKFGYDPDDVTTHRVCNTLEGVAMDGILFPRPVTPKTSYLTYQTLLCRPLKIEFDYAATAGFGIPVFWFKFVDDLFDNTSPDNSCFCNPDEKPCLPNGLSDSGACTFGMPTATSLPHFLYMNTSQFQTVDGMNPSEAKHKSSASFQENLGILMAMYNRLQLNLVMGDLRYNPKLKKLSHLVLPLMWIDYNYEELTGLHYFYVVMLVVVLPITQICCAILFGVVGLVFLTAFFIRTFFDSDSFYERRRWAESDGDLRETQVTFVWKN